MWSRRNGRSAGDYLASGKAEGIGQAPRGQTLPHVRAEAHGGINVRVRKAVERPPAAWLWRSLACDSSLAGSATSNRHEATSASTASTAHSALRPVAA